MEGTYKKSKEELFKELNSSKNGLSSIEAKRRLAKYGKNTLSEENKISKLEIFLNQFKDFIIYLLLFATAMTLLIGEYRDTILILIILIFNALIGFYQEYNAKKSLESLKKLVKINAKVYRNNELLVIDSSELVPGDVILLEAGDKVPADGRIIENNNLQVEESVLTGESKSVSKEDVTYKKDLSLADRKNLVFMSTIVTGGSAKVLVTNTGMNTEIGKITRMIKEAKEEMTPLQKRLDRFGKILGKVIIGIALLVFIISFLRDYLNNGLSLKTIIDLFLISISLMVAAVPTGLPIAVTVALSVGVKRLAEKKALVRKLSSVETLGSCDIICTDKTGTLTKNEMTVRKLFTFDDEGDAKGAGYSPNGEILNFRKNVETNKKLLEIGFFCNNSNVYKEDNVWKISGDPTEAALITVAKKSNLNFQNRDRILEMPFDSKRKLMSVLLKGKNNLFLVYTKGATDEILKRCSHYLKNGRKYKLTEEIVNKILEKNKEYSRKALRVLGFAYKEINDKKDFTEENLIFVGLQGMIDPPREEVKDALRKTKEAGIRTIMITGDHKETAIAIGKEVGIEGNAVSGEEIDKMSYKELEKVLNNNTNIFARVSPSHKIKIVEILQKNEHVVAMTGDGVNDAPALKKADIGVAVGSGTDVAKEASDFVLLDNGFNHIVNAIEEGRGIYDNIQKSIQLLLSGNITEVLIIFLAVIFGFNLPLTAVMLLWINMVTDGAPAIAYSLDPYDKNIMKRKPKSIKENILPLKEAIFIIIRGFFTTFVGLAIFSFYSNIDLNLGKSVIFTYLILYETLLALVIRMRYNVPFFSNYKLHLALITAIILQLIVIYTPLNKFFGIAVLGIKDWLILIFSMLLFLVFYYIYDFVESKITKVNIKIVPKKSI